MNIDFPLILVLLTAVTGLIWLVDSLFFKRGRQEKQARDESAGTEAPRTKEEEDEAPYLVDLSRSFFPILLVVLLLRSFLAEPFQIPSGSMLPTLKIGDFILVNKFAYGLRLPVARTKIVDIGEPQRGDVMVFKHYKTDEDDCRYNPSKLPPGAKLKDGDWVNYIKRVVGLPGDKIRYQDKTLYINGEKVETNFEALLPPRELYIENLGGVEHRIYRFIGRGDPGAEGDWVVPEGHYFMMGDNRDRSCDSRYWGFVPEELVVGKAFAIWMHWDLSDLPSLPSFDRVGGIE
ncbi:signal peptidase I [Marinobacteraceae bacterium S3BR75-40.1]